MNLYRWKFPIDLLNKPEPMRRIKFVMTIRKMVNAVYGSQRQALGGRYEKRDPLVRDAKA